MRNRGLEGTSREDFSPGAAGLPQSIGVLRLMNVGGTVEKAKLTRKRTRRLADDIRASLQEAVDHACGRRTGAVGHKIKVGASDARGARLKLAAFIETGDRTARNGSLARASRGVRRTR
jgi:putative transcriptional regulator